MTRADRFLVVGPSWVGDMIMSQSLYKLVRGRFPDCEIDVLAPRATVSLVSRMAEVSRGIPFAAGHGEVRLGYRMGLGEQLKKNRYDRAIVLPNSLKSALVPFFAGVPVRTGFLGEYRYFLLNDIRLLSRDRLPRMVDRFVALGVAPGAELPTVEYPELMVDAANLAGVRERLGLVDDRPVLGLCPGAEFGDAKRWPERHFAALAAHAIEAGMQVWILGGPADAATGQCVRASLPEDRGRSCFDLTGKTSLHDAIDLLSACALVVSNDSGLMHVAAAVGRPLGVLYGSTSPGFTPPLSERAIIFSEQLDCSPCFKRTCPLGHRNCLNTLMPERLFDLVDQHAGPVP